MNDYISAFVQGLVASLPSIIAVVSLLVNNAKADSRQLKDKEKSFELSLIESMYTEYNDIVNQYIGIITESRTRITNIVEEIVFCGTELKKQLYQDELLSFCKRVVYLAIFKRKAFDEFEIKIDPDGMAKNIVNDISRIIVYTSVVVYISKLFVVFYGELHDEDAVRQKVIEELTKKADVLFINDILSETECKNIRRNIDYESDNMNKQFEENYILLCEREKRMVCSNISVVIDSYSERISNCNTEEIDVLEEQIVGNIKRLVKKKGKYGVKNGY